MGKSAPRAPDPRETAAGQTSTNVGTAIANQITGQVNQSTPYGSLNYNQTGMQKWTDPLSGKVYDIPTYTAEQTFTPQGQRINDATMGTQENLANLGQDQSQRLGNLLSRPMNLQGLPERGGAPELQTRYGGNFAKNRQRVENTLMERMQPGLDRDRSSLEQRLADQGIQYGTAAYEAAMGDFNRQTNDARMSAVLAGGQEQSRLAGLSRDQATFGNQARGQQQRMSDAARAQALQERFAMRNQPLNEISALMSGSQVQQPNFMGGLGTSVANTDYAGIVNQDYANRMAQYNANQSNIGGLLGGAAGLMGAPAGSVFGSMMLSDKRAKKDIKKVGKTNDGQPIFSYQYKAGGPTQMGLMAQNVVKKRPEAVKRMPGGMLAVDYNKALGG